VFHYGRGIRLAVFSVSFTIVKLRGERCSTVFDDVNTLFGVGLHRQPKSGTMIDAAKQQTEQVFNAVEPSIAGDG